jgi:hypothetical protein
LPVVDPAESVGPYSQWSIATQPAATVSRHGLLIATQAFGENDPAVVRAIESLPFVRRVRALEYQTVLSLRRPS